MGKVLHLLRRIGINPAYLLIPITLSLISAIFEGFSVGLLIPILDGFFKKSFAFIHETPILKDVVQYLPEYVLEDDRMLFGVLLGGFVLMYILKNIMRYASGLSDIYFSQRAIHHLRKALFGRYLSFGKLYFDTSNVGHHSTLLLEFTKNSFTLLVEIGRFINAVFSLLVYFVIMLLISWKLTLIAIPLFMILHIAVRFIMVKTKELSHSIALRGSELGKKSVEILSTIPLVKSYSTQRQEQDRYTVISNEKARYDFQVRALGSMILPLQEVITVIFAVSILVGSLWWFGRDEIASASALIVYFYMVSNASSKFGGISSFRSTLASAAGPLDAVMDIFDEEDKHYVLGGTKEFTGLTHDISFSGLTFSYDSDRDVLRDVSFDVPKGKMTALVGATGSGKSTIISLLMRYYDCPPDTILIDGVDIREFTLPSYLSHTALVSQETLLLNDTLRNNITYGLEDVSDEDVCRAVQSARLAELIENLSEGLNTHIGDRGMKLSGGEKQRVSIARALLKGADILILDEATSSLDSHTEKLIQEAIDEAINGRTAIVIAHRLSTIKHADSIVVIDNGSLVEHGTLEELLEKRGTFYGLWEDQKFS